MNMISGPQHWLRERVRSSGSVFVAVGIVTAFAGHAMALQITQTAQPLKGDFVLNPAKVELTVSPGSSTVVDLQITNRDAHTRQFTVSTEDTAGSSDPSVPIVLLGDKVGPWSFRSNLIPEAQSFTLQPGEQAELPVTVTVPPNADPGGKYASVIISNSSPTADGSAGSQTVARLTALFFVRIPGQAQEGGDLESFVSSVHGLVTNEDPIQFDILFRNTGTVHLDPNGTIAITNMYGTSVGNITVEPFYTMPQSARDRSINWEHGTLFGRYTATLTLDEGYASTTVVRAITFWVLPIVYVVESAVIVLVVLLLLFFTFRNFEIRRR